MVHIPTNLSIDSAMASDLNTDLLGPFSSKFANVEPICVRKTIYLPAPYMFIFLEWYLTSVEAWARLTSAIINRGL